MSRDWHEQFKVWSKPPTEGEETKAAKAADMIRDALRSSPILASHEFDVYPTGSYRNNTNVRLDSDIDIAVVLTDAFYAVYPPNGPVTREALGFRDAIYGLPDFRNDVEKALIAKFGAAGVSPVNKTINVHESSKRLDADVTAFCEHRQYTGSLLADGTWHFYKGAETRSRKEPDKRIINWHQQHYEQGVRRNNQTRRRFKRLSRILKNLRNDMLENGTSAAIAAAEPIPSFLLECLVYNAPDRCFNIEEGAYFRDVRETILQLWDATRSNNACGTWMEVSGMKYLFHSTQRWSRPQANEFLLRAWEHIGFQ